VTLKDQPAHGACTMIRKRALLGVGGYSEEYRCQDGYDLWLRFIEKHEVENVNLPLFYYRRHGSNLTGNTRKILETRARIKEAHAERTKRPPLKCLGILPVRGAVVDPGCLALERLGDRLLIDWTVEAGISSKSMDMLVVSSPDKMVLDFVREKYGDQIMIHKRPLETARENVPLEATVGLVLEAAKDRGRYEALTLLSVESPFRASMYLDKAINTLRIFDVDTVIGVVPESDVFFQHNGQGLQPLGSTDLYGTLRLERDYIYRKVLGFHVARRSFHSAQGKTIGGCIGHVMFDPVDAFAVRNRTDLEVANLILQNGHIRSSTPDENA
jgi:CMP-N-acetylneuraminic acid synthetase